MSDGPEWFAPKRYGYGAGWPISWQGWAITLGFSVLLLLATLLMSHSQLGYFSTVAVLVVSLLVICSRTTRGGWRWRWGEED
jgi:uncharacterized membrane protein